MLISETSVRLPVKKQTIAIDLQVVLGANLNLATAYATKMAICVSSSYEIYKLTSGFIQTVYILSSVGHEYCQVRNNSFTCKLNMYKNPENAIN